MKRLHATSGKCAGGAKHSPGRKACKRIAALVLAAGMLLTGCGGNGSVNLFAGDKWVDSDVIGFVKAEDEIRLQDDFAAAVNKDWIANGNSAGVVYDIVNGVLAKKRAILEDTSFQSEGLDEVRKFFAMAEDKEYRESQGVEPLRKYIEKIEEISDTESLYKWICNTEDNPLGVAPVIIQGVAQSQADPTSNVTNLAHPILSLGNNEDVYFDITDTAIANKEAVEEKVIYVLEKLGYERAQIDRLLTRNYKMEKAFAGATTYLTVDEVRDIIYSRSDVKEAADTYPLMDFLDAWGFDKTERFFMDIAYVRQVAGLCRSSYIEDMKAAFIVRYVLEAGKYLDPDTQEAFAESDKARGLGKSDTDFQPINKEEYNLFSTYVTNQPALNAAMNKAYVGKYVDSENHDRLYALAEKIIDQYHDVFMSEDWLSDEGKEECIDKLDAVQIHVVSPNDDDLDLSGLDIISEEDGGNLLEAEFECLREAVRHEAELSLMAFDREYWDPYEPGFSTTETNAFYNAATNGIYILAGIVEDPVYRPGISDEELLGGLGAIIGHEITHGFDTNGSRYDKDGLERQWLPTADQMSFNDKCDKVASFYTRIQPYPNSGLYTGSQVTPEATADMGGMRVTLDIARQMQGFDYDAYFRAFARFFTKQVPLENEKEAFKGDVHPLNYLRINVAALQFDEFAETYGVKEGDGMYLAKEDRIKVW
ncbi:MAG: M13 family metallopeptidase [Lachnospiraceae bacterium]|nr:M13 family metallopeptidase [Lachnospiraceae bacterium]